MHASNWSRNAFFFFFSLKNLQTFHSLCYEHLSTFHKLFHSQGCGEQTPGLRGGGPNSSFLGLLENWVWVKKFQAEEILLPYIGNIYIAINNVQIDSHVLNFSYISTWFVVEPKICQFQILYVILKICQCKTIFFYE